MIFSVSVFNLINLIFIAAGIGICGLSLLQINASSHLRKEVRRYFQVFFSVIILYISAHLARQLMDGIPGRVYSKICTGAKCALLCNFV